MRIVVVTPGICDEASGTGYAVPGLCGGLAARGCHVSLQCLDAIPDRLRDVSYQIVNYPYVQGWLKGLGISRPMLKGLRAVVPEAEIVHSNGLWMMPNVYPYWATRGTSCKFVLQPHGTLSRWALNHSKWKKRLFAMVMQNAPMRHADMWVATAESEYEDIRRLGYAQPVCILPNGINLPDEEWAQEWKRNMPTRRRMYFLSRIHPKKNVELLLKAWSKLECRFSEWDLSIVGPDKNNPYADAMKGMAKELGCKRVSFEGEINGEDKQRFVTQSECIVLPTHSENFGMVIAEALACGTAAICSHGAPWEGLNRERCGWWVPTTEDDFKRVMSEAMSKSREELLAMGVRGREWMRRDFSWDVIGEKMKIAYEWLIKGGPLPEFVRI